MIKLYNAKVFMKIHYKKPGDHIFNLIKNKYGEWITT